MKIGFTLGLVVAFFLATLSANSYSQTVVATECNNCNDQSAKQAAISALYGESSTVYVINNTAQAVSKYNVTAHEEPGSYSVTAFKVTTDTWFKDIAEETWAALVASKDFTVPSAAAGSAFDFLRNSQNRGATMNQYNVSLNTMFGGLTTAISTSMNHLLAAFNMDQPQFVEFDFSDGSELSVQIEFGVELGSNAIGYVNWQYVPNTARLGNLFIPMNAADFSGFSTNGNVSAGVAGQLEALATAWGIPVVSAYGVRGIICDPVGCHSEVF